ncbi:MAG: hypothetical protein Q4G42_04475 [Neisseria sp.]|nr:hypothetical protein [Neisseria sp.]
MFKYENPKKLFENKIINILAGNNIVETCNALISLGLYDYDISWVESILLEKINSNNLDIASSAIVSLSHVVRNHKDIDIKKWMSVLDGIPLRIQLAGVAQDLIDDISIYSSYKRSESPKPQSSLKKSFRQP